jgi:excinuclease UvrABC nuclease subunit
MKGVTMAKKTVRTNKTSIGNLPENKPVMYKIKTASGNVNYVGVAKRGRIQERLTEHLSGRKDYVPGAKVQIEQFGSVAEARKNEAAAIKRIQPKHNG